MTQAHSRKAAGSNVLTSKSSKSQIFDVFFSIDFKHKIFFFPGCPAFHHSNGILSCAKKLKKEKRRIVHVQFD